MNQIEKIIDAPHLYLEAALRLDVGQRGMVAGRLSNQKGIKRYKAAEMLNVNAATVSKARLILQYGTQEEIRAVENGGMKINSVARAIMQRQPHIHKKSVEANLKGKHIERIQKQKIDGLVWGNLRDALVGLSELPLASDVVAIASRDKRLIGIVDDRIDKAIKWLTEFKNEWSNRDKNSA